MDKEDVMLKLEPQFQREIFQRLIDKYKGSINTSKKIAVPAVSIRGYKNLYFASVPKKLINKLIALKILNIDELNKNVKSTFSKSNKIKEILDYGRKKRREKLISLKEDIPHLKEIMYPAFIDFLSWFEKYKLLAESGFRKLKVRYKEDCIIVGYPNFARKKFKDFKIKLPKKFILNNEFVYFFGLWCGDRVGGKRMGISNKNKEINSFTESFLKKNYQKVEKILYIKKGCPEPNIKYDKKFSVESRGNGWVLAVHSNNGILSTFFHYLQQNLTEFLSKIPNKNAFFAGLFDAEGNVSLYNKSFRWACANKKLVEIYSKFLKGMSLYGRYDGSCLISYNKKEFYNKIYPYLKHPEKINSSLLLCTGSGKLLASHLKILDFIKRCPGKTAKEISKGLKRSKVYSELKLLGDFNFVYHEGYPYKFGVTKKGLKSLGGK